MAGKEVLEDALNAYEGTVLAISHDRYFINRVSNRILELFRGGFLDFKGNYDYYLEKRDQVRENLLSENESAAKTVSREKEARLVRKEEDAKRRKYERELQALESSIDALSKEIAGLDDEMAEPSIASDAARLTELQREKEEKEELLGTLYANWEKMLENP